MRHFPHFNLISTPVQNPRRFFDFDHVCNQYHLEAMIHTLRDNLREAEVLGYQRLSSNQIHEFETRASATFGLIISSPVFTASFNNSLRTEAIDIEGRISSIVRLMKFIVGD